MGINLREIGRGLAAARELAGFRSADALVTELYQRHGIRISASSIYGYERGENEPPFSIVYAIIDVCDPPGGLDFFARALSSEATGTNESRASRQSSRSSKVAASRGKRAALDAASESLADTTVRSKVSALKRKKPAGGASKTWLTLRPFEQPERTLARAS